MFVGKGNNKDKGRNGWLRTEKEAIRLINKIRSHFFGEKVREDKKRISRMMLSGLQPHLSFTPPQGWLWLLSAHTTYIFSAV